MQKTIIDSGPLIALFDKNDKYHKTVLNFLEGFHGEFITTWSVITEVTHMLDFNLNVQIDFLKWIELGAVTIYNIEQKELREIIRMMSKYTDVPMDLADSTLMYVAQKEKIQNIVSIDSDFDIYRTIKKQALCNLLKVY
ncbi:MAG: PIN domain-containing protein [Epsilonproteobacteria bacterium]|nr:PIN domain-containing protein [Campylobacterota bacterium]